VSLRIQSCLSWWKNTAGEGATPRENNINLPFEEVVKMNREQSFRGTGLSETCKTLLTTAVISEAVIS